MDGDTLSPARANGSPGLLPRARKKHERVCVGPPESLAHSNALLGCARDAANLSSIGLAAHAFSQGLIEVVILWAHLHVDASADNFRSADTGRHLELEILTCPRRPVIVILDAAPALPMPLDQVNTTLRRVKVVTKRRAFVTPFARFGHDEIRRELHRRIVDRKTGSIDGVDLEFHTPKYAKSVMPERLSIKNERLNVPACSVSWMPIGCCAQVLRTELNRRR